VPNVFLLVCGSLSAFTRRLMIQLSLLIASDIGRPCLLLMYRRRQRRLHPEVKPRVWWKAELISLAWGDTRDISPSNLLASAESWIRQD
jgi:hypothetical protein